MNQTHQGGGSDRGKVVSVAIVGSTASSGGNLWLVHLRLVGVVIDVILTLRRRKVSLNPGHSTQRIFKAAAGVYRGPVDDGAVGGDGVLALLHHGHLAAAVVGGVGQTVDRAALRTG